MDLKSAHVIYMCLYLLFYFIYYFYILQNGFVLYL